MAYDDDTRPGAAARPRRAACRQRGRARRCETKNDRLASTLREARDQILALKEEIDRLAQPPSGFGVFLERHDDDTVDIFTGGRKLRVAISPDIAVGDLKRGQEVMLNEATNVIRAMEFERVGEVVMLKEILEDGERALVLGHTDEERIVRLAATLDDAPCARATRCCSSHAPATSTSGSPSRRSRSSSRRGSRHRLRRDRGLGPQIETIRDAVELPYLHPDLFKEHQLKPPKGSCSTGPPAAARR